MRVLPAISTVWNHQFAPNLKQIHQFALYFQPPHTTNVDAQMLRKMKNWHHQHQQQKNRHCIHINNRGYTYGVSSQESIKVFVEPSTLSACWICKGDLSTVLPPSSDARAGRQRMWCDDDRKVRVRPRQGQGQGWGQGEGKVEARQMTQIAFDFETTDLGDGWRGETWHGWRRR